MSTPTTLDAAQARDPRSRILGLISLCHCLNDMMQSLILASYPLLKQNHGLSFTQGLRTRTSYGFEPKYPDAFFVRPCGGLALHAQAHLAVFSHRDWPHQIQHHLFQ